MAEFPTDEVTLTMLDEACRINPDNEQTNLMAFLEMGARVRSEQLLGDEGGIPMYEIEYEPGYEPWSEQDVILALTAEVRRLRASVAEPEGNDG